MASPHCSDYKEVGCVKNSKVFSTCRKIVQLDGRRLVVILQHVIVALRFQNRGQLDSVAFKLDNAPRRLGASDVRDNRASRIG